MRARTQRAEDMPAVELGSGEKVQRSGKQADPGCAAHRIEEQVASRHAWVQERGQDVQDQRGAENEPGVRRVRQAGNVLGMEDAVGQRRERDDESDDRARCTDVE